MKLSIVIPIFNKWNFTKSCLEDLAHLPKETHEIIVVDNASSDETAAEMGKLSHIDNLAYVRNEQNMGFAAACNRGFALASGEKIMFLNNDIRVKSDHSTWTQPILDAEDNNLIGPTGGLVDPANNFQFVYETGDPKKKINYMGGWCLSASRETWKKLHLVRPDVTPCRAQVFSEEFGLAYFEDTDVGFRAKKLGIGFKLIEIPVIHFGKISSGQLNTHELYSKARKIFIQKWQK